MAQLSGRQARYKRILLKLSGEALMGSEDFGIDPKVLDRMALESVDTLGQLLPLVVQAANESALLAGVSDDRQCKGGIDCHDLYAVVIVDDFDDVRPTHVGHDALLDLEIARAWTPWGPRMPQLIGDPRNMSEQLRAAEGRC